MSVQALHARRSEASSYQSRTTVGEFSPLGVDQYLVFGRSEAPCPLAPRLSQASSFPIRAWFPSLCRRRAPLPPGKRDAAAGLRNHAVGGRLMSIPAVPSTAEIRAGERPMLAPDFGAIFSVRAFAESPSHRGGPARTAATGIAPDAPNRPQLTRPRVAPVPIVAKKSDDHCPGASVGRAVHVLAWVHA